MAVYNFHCTLTATESHPPTRPRQLILVTHRQTSDAHSRAIAAPAQLYPALRPARPHALKNRHYAPTPAFLEPPRCSVSRATQIAPAPAAALSDLVMP